MDGRQKMVQRHLQLRGRQFCAEQHGELIAPQPPDGPLASEDVLQGFGDLLQGAVPLRMAMPVVDLFELIQIHHDEVAGRNGIARAEDPGAYRKKRPAGHHAGQGVDLSLIGHIGAVLPVQRHKQDHQHHQGHDAEHELDLKVEDVHIARLPQRDPLALQHIVDPVAEIEGDGKRGGKREKRYHRQGQPAVAFAALQGLGDRQALLKLDPGPGVRRPPEEQHNQNGTAVHSEIGHGKDISKHGGGAIAGLRKADGHGAVHQERMDRPAQIGHQSHPEIGMPHPARPRVQQADQQAEQHAAAHAEEQTRQGMPAEHRREELVGGQDIAGRGLPHAGKAKDQAHHSGLQGAQQCARQHHRQKGYGDRNGRDVKIAEEGEGHQQLKGDQRHKHIPVQHIAPGPSIVHLGLPPVVPGFLLSAGLGVLESPAPLPGQDLMPHRIRSALQVRTFYQFRTQNASCPACPGQVRLLRGGVKSDVRLGKAGIFSRIYKIMVQTAVIYVIIRSSSPAMHSHRRGRSAVPALRPLCRRHGLWDFVLCKMVKIRVLSAFPISFFCWLLLWPPAGANPRQTPAEGPGG